MLQGSASCGSTPAFAYFESPASGAAWTLVQGWTTSPFTFNTEGMADGTYQFLVWATDGPLTTPQSQTSISYQLVTPTACSALSVSASADSGPGIPATLTTSADCPAAASYAYFYQPAGGSWTLAQGWTQASTFSFNTSQWAPGPYNLLAWVGDDLQASPQLQEEAAYTVTQPGSGCAGGGASTGTGGLPGQAATLTVNPDCAPGYSPSYAYFEAPAGGGWTLVQGWTSDPSHSYNTSGWAPGSYQLMAWVGENGGAPLSETQIATWVVYPSSVEELAANPGPGPVIVVQLGAENLTAYDNGQVVLTTPVTTGMPGLRTPRGSTRFIGRHRPSSSSPPGPGAAPTTTRRNGPTGRWNS